MLLPTGAIGWHEEGGGLPGHFGLEKAEIKVCSEQDSNPLPSVCETCAFLLHHQAFHIINISEVVFKVEGRADRQIEENPLQTPLPLRENLRIS